MRLKVLITLDRNGAESLQEQIYQRIREQIVTGTLRAGAAVPSSRLLATQLKVSRNSVIFGYERLINEGYLIARPMVGTFVADVLPDRAVGAERVAASEAEPRLRSPSR